MRRLEAEVAEAPDAPDYWRADVDRVLEINRRALAEPPPLRLEDSSEVFDDTAARQACERLQAFAATLEAWPALWDWAAGDGEHALGDALGSSGRP